MKNRIDAMVRFLETTAWVLVLMLVAGLAVAGMAITAQLRAPEVIRYVFGSVIGHGLSAMLIIAALCALSHLMNRHKWLMIGLAALWTVGTAALMLGMRTFQEADFLYVCQAANAFAAGDMSPMHSYYFNEYSYQLGAVLLLEGVARVVPWMKVDILMQAINALFSIAAAGLLAALGVMAFEDKRVHASTMALYLLCIPFAVYCIHVYGTLPMVCMSAAAMLCFAWHLKTGKERFGVLYVLFIALAYMLKPNAAVVVIAHVICALLYAVKMRRIKPLGYALLGAVMAIALARLAIAQYEWRSGVTLREDVSMQARLVMGLQDGPRAAGWYNGYTEQFFDSEVSAAQEKEIAMQDLVARMDEMAADPVRTVIFTVQKALSQWLEPTYGTLLYGNHCRQGGVLAEAAKAIFSEESALRMALEGLMKGWQMVMYALAGVGLAGNLRRRRGAEALVLPVCVLGGFLYHMIFEAKSQYIYVYALYLVPLAGYGFYLMEDALRRRLACRKR